MLPDQVLQELVRSGADDVKTSALETLGNLAFCRGNRAAILGAEGLKDWLARLAQDKVGHNLMPCLHLCGSIRVLMIDLTEALGLVAMQVASRVSA